MTINIAVLVSGRGSNLQSVIDSIESGDIQNAAIKVVISDIGDAYALERARNHRISTVFIDPSSFENKQAFEQEILRALKGHDIGLILLAGYMRIMGKEMIRTYRNRIINIHPALLPSFMGLHAQQQAFDYGVKVSGCTVHFVDEGMDTGPIILQKCVPVMEDDTAETLAARILEQEHKILPEAVKLFVEGKLKVEGRVVVHT
ncbi:phosphoribosylglycinamide formyltransferase [Methanolobus halotolerans]|uniref:phosphoribosylglycinamide formyltransferase 1 n=1 Tax=Methanolobus halotolerans TaxID=2052935 RepID=A0A4E0QXB1_9EURY|nr:phosphoribosylglycinamide formyltransferase [Methanolobus halotolerans]TGC07392.1 phosphoribosylglycinamide formyltransferase [Methanolobus halotolerans]